MDTLVQKQLYEELDRKDSVQIVKLMKKITLYVTCSIFFDLPDGEEKDQLLEDFSITLKGVWAVPSIIPGTTLHRALQARGRVCKLLSKLILNRKTQMEEGTVDSQDNIISSLLVLRHKNGEPLLEREVLDIFLTLIIASHDTTTILLSHFVRHLVRDPREQREIVKAKQQRDGKLSWNEMQMMKYTCRVAQELMRFTPVFGNFRLITRDVTFNGFDIPQDLMLLQVQGHFPHTYIPFGAGRRICPGAEFARIESLLVIHYLITEYEWTQLIPDEPITRDPVLYPAMGLPFKLSSQKICIEIDEFMVAFVKIMKVSVHDYFQGM